MDKLLGVFVAAPLAFLAACDSANSEPPKAEPVVEESGGSLTDAERIALLEAELEALRIENHRLRELLATHAPAVDAGEAPRSGRTVGDGVDRAVEATGRGLQVAGEKTEEGVRTAVEKTEEGLGTAAEKTGSWLQRMGRKLERAGEGEPEESGD